MLNLQRLFRPNPLLLPVSKTEREILEYFITHKQAFENWSLLHPEHRIRFQFYFPTAVDFYFDEFKLFTAYFKRRQSGSLEFRELKMSEANHTTIRSVNWQPFEEVMLRFFNSLEENNKAVMLRENKSLHEYTAICMKSSQPTAEPRHSEKESVLAGKLSRS
jgi:hypothetical protein